MNWFQALRGNWVVLALALALALMGAGCTAPIGADRVTTQYAFAQVDDSALRTGKPGADTEVIVHRYDLGQLAARQPDEAVRQLHRRAVETGERDLLFALSELSYVAGNQIRRSVKPWDHRDARDYYLGSALYAWLYLFGEGKDPKPDPFDRRFRLACDLYNYNLGLALLTDQCATNVVVGLENGRRHLPEGSIDLQLRSSEFSFQPDGFDQLLLADRFRVRGLSVRNRDPGIGAPIICAKQNVALGVGSCTPATVLLRGPASLAELGSGSASLALEVYAGLDPAKVEIGGVKVPLEVDRTTYRAYVLNDARIWELGSLQFMAPSEYIPNRLLLNQVYDPNRIPVVFVHGTFSSPVTWAEMGNSLIADPVLRQRYQIWTFIYGSGNPLVQSLADLRSALTAEVQKLDPTGTNAALRQMVVIGHSQGGLLTKGTAIDAGDKIWRTVSTNRIEDLKIPEANRANLRRLIFLEPLPFVKRVIFIATPHRGSYLAGGFVRGLAQRLVSLPGALVSRKTDLFHLTAGSETGKFLAGRIPTSLDGMSPKNPGLRAMAEIPVVPEIKAHSIIAVRGDGDYHKGRDGLVSYQSAHVDYAQSEFIVRSFHTCLEEPATIEEVRRILHQHLDESPFKPE